MKTGACPMQVGIEGVLLAVSPALLLIPFLGEGLDSPVNWALPVSIALFAGAWASAFAFAYLPRLGKALAGGTVLACYGAAYRQILADPFVALVSTIVIIFLVFSLFDTQAHNSRLKGSSIERCLQRARWSVLTALMVALGLPALSVINPEWISRAIVASAVISGALFCHWAAAVRSISRIVLALLGAAGSVAIFFFFPARSVAIAAATFSFINLLTLPKAKSVLGMEERWWGLLLNHPARILCTTFSGLCLFGTVLLILPISTRDGGMGVIDAVFTSVSAVCVTGLIVVDTPHFFTFYGQLFLLLLIQLGGLGIMSITAVAMHALGKRLSLKHERLLNTITATSHHDVVEALRIILKFTFIAEGAGATALGGLFWASGDTPGVALWRGIFTSISAFCNAGFALQSDSLIPYQENPLVLHVVALLIIFGGIAPATSLLVPQWLSRKKVPIAAHISLMTTAVLLFVGTFCILAFEWGGILGGLSITDKIQNAWFQSVTLRTAGFNSVDLAHVSSPTFLVMIAFMFVGGSPGGTAGGIKTTTLGLLVMTFWANIANRDEVVTGHRRLHPATIYRAVTIIISGSVLWFFVVLMLEVTQRVSSRALIFEATSAIGTVGLSIGATPQLDEIGKVIIVLAMFAGRIGPVTLFMLLSDQQPSSDTRYPVESVSIT